MWKLVVPVLLCTVVGRFIEREDDERKMDVFRLPGNTRPESYDLRFVLNFNGKNSTFSGVTKIIIVPSSTTKVVTLNVKDLNVTNVEVRDVGGPSPGHVKISDSMLWENNEQFEIRLVEAAVVGRRYLVTISYEGNIRTDLTGLYMSFYEEGDVTK